MEKYLLMNLWIPLVPKWKQELDTWWRIRYMNNYKSLLAQIGKESMCLMKLIFCR